MVTKGMNEAPAERGSLEYLGQKTGAFKMGQGRLDSEEAAPAEPFPVSVVGQAAKGPINEATKIATKEEFEQIFGAIGKLSVENVRGLIVQECRALEELLLEKNAGYGNSALDPIRLFSRAAPLEQIKVRIDDKLSRISRGDFSKVKEEDLKVVTKDLLGYLILIRVGWRLGLE